MQDTGTRFPIEWVLAKGYIRAPRPPLFFPRNHIVCIFIVKPYASLAGGQQHYKYNGVNSAL